MTQHLVAPPALLRIRTHAPSLSEFAPRSRRAGKLRRPPSEFVQHQDPKGQKWGYLAPGRWTCSTYALGRLLLSAAGADPCADGYPFEVRRADSR